MSDGPNMEPTQAEIERVQEFLAHRQCGTEGHDFQITALGTGAPALILCDRCGESWSVVQH